MPTNSNRHTDFKITMINVCNDLVEKVDNTHRKMGNLADKWKVFKSNENAKNSHSSSLNLNLLTFIPVLPSINGILDTTQMDLDALSRIFNVIFWIKLEIPFLKKSASTWLTLTKTDRVQYAFSLTSLFHDFPEQYRTANRQMSQGSRSNITYNLRLTKMLHTNGIPSQIQIHLTLHSYSIAIPAVQTVSIAEYPKKG